MIITALIMFACLGAGFALGVIFAKPVKNEISEIKWKIDRIDEVLRSDMPQNISKRL